MVGTAIEVLVTLVEIVDILSRWVTAVVEAPMGVRDCFIKRVVFEQSLVADSLQQSSESVTVGSIL